MGGYDEPDMVKPLSVKAAAQRLGLTEYGTRGLIEAGKLRPVVRTPSIKLSAADVEDLRVARRDAAVTEFTARGVDLVKLAGDTRRMLRPEALDPVTGGETGLSRLPSNVRAFFGPAALAALTLPDRGQCCWCAARVAAQLLKVPEPRYGEVTQALLGDPCREDMSRFADAELSKLRARVHPGSVRPSVARSEPVSTAGRPVVSKPVPRAAERAVAASVTAARGDDGKSMVARRLRETRSRLKDARRRGDKAYALRLAQTVRSLEQDAAVVDGRAVAASASRPGTLRCGHALADGCRCPRRASKR